MRPNLRDENDNAFVDLAFASGSAYLITQNVRDFTVGADIEASSYYQSGLYLTGIEWKKPAHSIVSSCTIGPTRIPGVRYPGH